MGNVFTLKLYNIAQRPKQQFTVWWLFPLAFLSFFLSFSFGECAEGSELTNDTGAVLHSPSSGGLGLGSALRSPSPVSTAHAAELCLEIDLKAAASLRRSTDS